MPYVSLAQQSWTPLTSQSSLNRSGNWQGTTTRSSPPLWFLLTSNRLPFLRGSISPVLRCIMLSGSPNRLTDGSEAMTGVLNQLNWRNDTRFVQLSGVLPVEPGIPFQDGVIDFSTVTSASDKVRLWSRFEQSFVLISSRMSPTRGGM